MTKMTERIIVDSSNMILGRLASYVAKQALMGKEVSVINCENAVITGDKQGIYAEYKQARERGTPTRGPFIHRYPDRIVRRSIKGMLPMTRTRGKEAFARITTYIGVPDELKAEKAVSVEGADIKKVTMLKYTDIKSISKTLGAKIE
jgi:large subunit ribosomal protein L13